MNWTEEQREVIETRDKIFWYPQRPVPERRQC